MIRRTARAESDKPAHRARALFTAAAVLVMVGVASTPAYAPTTKDKRDIIVQTTDLLGGSTLVAGIQLAVDSGRSESVSTTTRSNVRSGAFVARSEAYSDNGTLLGVVSAQIGARVERLPLLARSTVRHDSTFAEGPAEVVANPDTTHRREYRGSVVAPLGLVVEDHTAIIEVRVEATEGFTVARSAIGGSHGILEIEYQIRDDAGSLVATIGATVTTETTARGAYMTGPITIDDEDA